MKPFPIVMSALVATAALGAATGCGGSSSGGSSSAESSAKSAATSFIAALKAKDAASTCKYISFPANVKGTCVQGIGQLVAAGGLTGNPTVANAAVSGNQALVVTTGNFSLAGTTINNSDSNAGLPSGSTTFAQAYAKVQHEPKSPDLTMVKTGSQWLVVLGS